MDLADNPRISRYLPIRLDHFLHPGKAGRRSQLRDQPHVVGKESSWDGHLGHLECGAAPVVDDLGTDLDEFVLERRQRALVDRIGYGL